jgi:large subunit ribosomal protein L18
MVSKKNKNAARLKRHIRVRAKISGTAERPRLAVYRSENNISAQIIDDVKGITLVSASSYEKEFETGGNKESARRVGKLVAERAVEKGITEVVFDRGGYLYHGRVSELAEGAREGGLKF